MEDADLHMGPNGGLVYCMEYLLENPKWLEEQLGDFTDDYILFDCPGQIELYTHMTVMQRLVDQLQRMDFRVCSVFLLDTQFLLDMPKFFAGIFTALSSMIGLELPHVTILSKMDLLTAENKQIVDSFLEPDSHLMLSECTSKWHQRYHRLSTALSKLIDDFSLVSLTPLDVSDEDSISQVCVIVDNCLQYGEDEEVREDYADMLDAEDDDEERTNGKHLFQ